jgi:ADP-ribose pyrophosphatase
VQLPVASSQLPVKCGGHSFVSKTGNWEPATDNCRYIHLMPNRPKPSMRVLSQRVVFRGPIFYVTSERIKEPTGVEVRRDMIRHPGSVVVMVMDDSAAEPRILLARQYRYAAKDRLWELPAGRVDPGESELDGAKRELLEETGYTAKRWRLAMHFYVSPGFLDETMAVYVASDLQPGKSRPQEDEVIAKRFFPLSSAVRMVMSGKIRDAKTIAGVLWLAQSERSRSPRNPVRSRR